MKLLGFLACLGGLLVLAVGPAQAKQAHPGSLDPTFGKVMFQVADGGISAASVQADGKIVAGGGVFVDCCWGSPPEAFSEFALARLDANGSVDGSFGNDGIVGTPILAPGAEAPDDSLSALALQPDGKIVAAGYAHGNNWTEYLALVRYNPDGSLDSSFGTGGIVLTPDSTLATPFSFAFLGVDVALQPDGKIVVAGSHGKDFLVSRYDADGSLDPSFGTGGLVTTDFKSRNDGASSLVLQADGKIVVAGGSTLGSCSSAPDCTPLDSNFALARYKRDGSLDSSFGTGGRVLTPIQYGGAASALALQPNGKIVAVGGVKLIRYTTGGSLDRSFGANGKVTVAPVGASVVLSSVAVTGGGKIVLAGTAQGGYPEFALLRYLPDGSLDRYFGRGGIVTSDPNAPGSYGGSADALALQPDGRMILAGEAFDGLQEEFAVERFLGGNLSCTVSRVIGRKLAQAKSEIRRSNCRVGRVRTKFSVGVKKGRVISQQPRAHTRHPAGTKVSLVASKGRRRSS